MNTESDEWLVTAIDYLKVRARTINDIRKQLYIRLLDAFVVRDVKADQAVTTLGVQFYTSLRLARVALERVSEREWYEQRLDMVIREVARDADLKLFAVAQPIRIALTGTTVSEPVNQLLFLVGREGSLRRIIGALAESG